MGGGVQQATEGAEGRGYWGEISRDATRGWGGAHPVDDARLEDASTTSRKRALLTPSPLDPSLGLSDGHPQQDTPAATRFEFGPPHAHERGLLADGVGMCVEGGDEEGLVLGRQLESAEVRAAAELEEGVGGAASRWRADYLHLTSLDEKDLVGVVAEGEDEAARSNVLYLGEGGGE
ncbi:MAG: hypothetical protein SGPRY_001920 [Prymnesium sp.]